MCIFNNSYVLLVCFKVIPIVYALGVPSLIGMFRDWGINMAMVRCIAQYRAEGRESEIRSVVVSGFKYLNNESSNQPSLLFTYKLMEKNGYILSAHGITLPANWTQKTDNMNSVYSNGYSNIYSGVAKP
jgi:hypothetical protein